MALISSSAFESNAQIKMLVSQFWKKKKKERKRCMATPESDTVQDSLKWPGLYFPVSSTPSFSPGPQEHLSRCDYLTNSQMEQNCSRNFQLSKNKQTKQDYLGRRVKQAWLNQLKVYEILDYRLNNSKQGIFLLFYTWTHNSLLWKKANPSTFCFLLL